MSILEGITERSTKAVILDRLREAARKIGAAEDAKVARLQEIEERVRAKHQAHDRNLKQLMVTSTVEEWVEVVDFLDNFEELLPRVAGGSAAS